MKTLTWKQDGYLYFAHSPVGMWTIEQHRGRYKLELWLAGTPRGAEQEQDMGAYPSLAKAKAGASRSNRTFIFMTTRKPRVRRSRRQHAGPR